MTVRGRWGAVLLLAVTFVAGGLAGGAVVASAEREGERPKHGPWWQGGGSDRHVRRLTEELDLSPAQRDSVRAILRRRGRALEAVWREVEPRFEALRDSIRSDIRAQLTPEQADRYTELLRRRDAERKRMRDMHERD